MGLQIRMQDSEWEICEQTMDQFDLFFKAEKNIIIITLMYCRIFLLRQVRGFFEGRDKILLLSLKIWGNLQIFPLKLLNYENY